MRVLITGAGSGIGRALAIQADRQGHGLILVGRRAGPLEQTAAGLRDALAGRLTPAQRRAAARLNIDRMTRALGLIASLATPA